tara:strand:- start:1608 stop:2645 length:1038 start_codon:yes stop_codon:yes gene_type:complete
MIENIFNRNIEILIDNINKKKKWNLNPSEYFCKIDILNNKLKKRCIGRIYDKPDERCKRSTNIKEKNLIDFESMNFLLKKWNINKRCSRQALINELCNSCNKREKDRTGLSNEYPSDELINEYNNGIEQLKKKYFNKLEKKNYLESEYNELKKVLSRDVRKEIDISIKNKYCIKKKNDIKKISNKQCRNMLESNIQAISNNNNDIDNDICINDNIITNKLLYKTDIYQNWWDSEMTDKVVIYDHEQHESFIFAMEITEDGNYLLNKNQQILGEYREWEDTNFNLLDCFKNNANKVLHPISAIPLLEFEIYKESTVYHNITCKIYREYRYDLNKEALVNTNCIEIL